MIRYFLARGDRAGSATITEGLERVTCSNPPPRVQIATLYMKTYCMACKQEGYVAPEGPRWPGTGPNGKQWALSGDINICGCTPPPVFYAERGMKMTFTSQEVDRLMGRDTRSTTAAAQSTVVQGASGLTYDEQVRASAMGAALGGYPYFIETADGRAFPGRVDFRGTLPRVITNASADDYTVFWGEDALVKSSEV